MKPLGTEIGIRLVDGAAIQNAEKGYYFLLVFTIYRSFVAKVLLKYFSASTFFDHDKMHSSPILNLFAASALFAGANAASGTGTTTRYWDCCKPSCAVRIF